MTILKTTKKNRRTGTEIVAMEAGRAAFNRGLAVGLIIGSAVGIISSVIALIIVL